jgi:hypothetical protein
MTIRVLSFDFDGCLFNLRYIDSENKDVITYNQPFLDSLKKENNKYTQSFAFIGSNRQSKEVDDMNARPANKGSCFPAIQKVARYLGIKLDTFLLADIYGDLADGVSFAKAIEKPLDNLHASWTFDETKATILYAQMHKMACAFPNEPIEFEFYDDRDDILNELQNFYSKHHHLIPENITLKLIQYAGNAPQNRATIKGTGFIDGNYRQTVKDMAEQAEIKEGLGSMMIHATHHVEPEQLKNRVPLAEHLLKTHLAIIQRKAARLRADKHINAADAADALYTRVKDALDLHTVGQCSKHYLRDECDKAITDAHKELDHHRGWTECLGNLALLVLGIVGLIIKGCINLHNNKPFLFFSKTKSAQMLDEFQTALEQIAPSA